MIDETVGFCVLGRHKAIAVGVLFNRVKSLAGVMSEDFVQTLLGAKDFLSLNADIGGLALGAAEGLMDHDPRVGQAVPFAFGARGEKDSSHAGGLADAVGVHLAGDVLHGVVDRQPCGDIATRGVNIDADVFLGVFHLKEKKLGDNRVRHGVIDRRPDENDPILEKTGIDVVGTFASAGLFNDAGDEVVCFRF